MSSVLFFLAGFSACWDTMPAIISKNSDLDFDYLQLCFYPDEYEDDLYFCGPDSVPRRPPGEDIWKKFELLPIPPLSPSQAALPGGGADAAATLPGSMQGFGLGDPPLDWASDDLDLFGSGALDSSSNNPTSNIIIQDCMWSGISAREKLQLVVTEKLQGKAMVSTAATATTSSSSSSSTTAGQQRCWAPQELILKRSSSCTTLILILHIFMLSVNLIHTKFDTYI